MKKSAETLGWCASSFLPMRTLSRRLPPPQPMSKINHEVEAKMTGSEQADAPGDESDEDFRPSKKQTWRHTESSRSKTSRLWEARRGNPRLVEVAVPSRRLGEKARAPQHSVSELFSYLMRHDTHGNDCGVVISMILNEMRIGDGGDSCRPHVRDALELIDMLKMGSNKLRFHASYVEDNAHSHSAVGALRMYHGTCFCNIDSILKHGSLPGKATESGRSDMLLQRSPHDRLETKGFGDRDDGYDSDDIARTALQ